MNEKKSITNNVKKEKVKNDKKRSQDEREINNFDNKYHKN